MRALTVIQPFASALVTPRLGISVPWKLWENRIWTPNEKHIGEWIAIHAGGARYHPLGAAHRDLWPEPATLTRSAVVGLVRFGPARRYEDVAGEPWTIAPPPGKQGWCWPALECLPLSEPVLCLGALGLWTLPEAIEEQVLDVVTRPAHAAA